MRPYGRPDAGPVRTSFVFNSRGGLFGMNAPVLLSLTETLEKRSPLVGERQGEGFGFPKMRISEAHYLPSGFWVFRSGTIRTCF